MRIASMAMVVSAAWLAGCAAESGVAPVLPSRAIQITGNPPPPRVLGTMSAAFLTTPVEPSATQQWVFATPAYYNRNLTTGMNALETSTGTGRIRADAAGVILASGIVVLVNPVTGAQLTLDLSQLSGFTGPLFVPCPTGSPVNCFDLNSTLAGIIQPVTGAPLPATGRLRFRWETN